MLARLLLPSKSVPRVVPSSARSRVALRRGLVTFVHSSPRPLVHDTLQRATEAAGEAMGSIFGTIDVETPPYDVLVAVDAKDGRPAYELRKYGALYAVETPMGVGESGAFRRLAGYIGVGATPRNDGAKPVAMTAPVVTRGGEGTAIAMTAPVVSKGQVMSFLLPASKYRPGVVGKEPPSPTDPNVRITEVPARTAAAYTFSGSISDADSTYFNDLKKALVGALVADGVLSQGQDVGKLESELGRFNPPWCLPFLRTNEVLVTLPGGGGDGGGEGEGVVDLDAVVARIKSGL